MKAFLISIMVEVLTNEKVKAMLKQLMKNAVDEAMVNVKQIVADLPNQIDALEIKTFNNLDGIDGKFGNLQEQLTLIPGQIIKGIATNIDDAIEQAINRFNPFGPR